MMVCSVCHSDRVTRMYTVREFDLYRCLDCTHRFVPGVTDDQVESYYGRDYYNGQVYRDYVGDLEPRMAASDERLARIEALRPSRGALLDYGCAVGVFVKAARRRGWDARGYERSAWAVEYGTEVLNVPITLGHGLEDGYEPSAFDVVTAWDVLEHLVAPHAVVGRVARWLRPGGIFAVSTVNAGSLGARLAGREWRHLGPPWHLQYFTRRSLEWLLKRHGLKIVRRWAEGSCLRAHGRGTGTSARIDRVVRYWRWRKHVTALSLLDEQLIWARKVG